IGSTTAADPNSLLTINATSSTSNNLTLKMLSNQTGNALQVWSSASSTVFAITASGGISANASSSFSQNLEVKGTLSASSTIFAQGIDASASSTFRNRLQVS